MFDTIQRIYILATTYIQGAVGEVFTRHGGARGIGGVEAQCGGRGVENGGGVSERGKNNP